MERVVAEVVLRAPDGGSVLDRPPGLSAEDLDRSRPSAEAVRRARELLEARGLRIDVTGPVGFTVSCDPGTFERVFGTPPAPGEPVPVVPDEMADVVAAVVIPMPPELFG